MLLKAVKICGIMNGVLEFLTSTNLTSAFVLPGKWLPAIVTFWSEFVTVTFSSVHMYSLPNENVQLRVKSCIRTGVKAATKMSAGNILKKEFLLQLERQMKIELKSPHFKQRSYVSKPNNRMNETARLTRLFIRTFLSLYQSLINGSYLRRFYLERVAWVNDSEREIRVQDVKATRHGIAEAKVMMVDESWLWNNKLNWNWRRLIRSQFFLWNLE